MMVKPNTKSRSGYHTRIVKNLVSRTAKMKRRLEHYQKREEQLLQAITKLEKTVEESNIKFERLRKDVEEEFSVMRERLDKADNVNDDGTATPTDVNFNTNTTDLNQITNIVSENRKNVEQLDLRLQLNENTTYNGRILWKIDHFQSRRNQVLSGKMNALHSAPGYTRDQLGYKFCLRIYPNGDGIGQGTHLSLFLVVMKSDYDELLQWPFNHQVKFTLINQRDRSKDIFERMTPNRDSPSFQKPVGEMNIASGCPLFVELGRLDREGYVHDDCLFIDVVVEK